MKKKHFYVAFLVAVFLVAAIKPALAQEEPFPDIPDLDVPALEIPGRIEGAGTYFEVTDSEYLNVTLESTEPLKVTLESAPQMVLIHMEAAEGATSSQITLGGFTPSTTYYKYDDDYHNGVTVTTDANGSYTYTQDLSSFHLVFILPNPSTYFIKDDATGGDCTLLGIWDSALKTCTLTTDVYETIQIDSDGVTLDGAGHKVTGVVYLPTRTGVTIIDVTGAIYLFGSSNNTLTGNTASNSANGIALYDSSNNILTGNTASNNSYRGIWLDNSSSNTLTGNTMSGNYFNFGITGSSDSHFVQIIDTTNTVDGKPIYYVVGANDEVYDSSTNAGVFYAINCSNITIKDLTLSNNEHGVFLLNTHDSTIENVNTSTNYYPIWLQYSSNNTLTGNTVSDPDWSISGIYLEYSNSNILTGNTVSNIYCSRSGIYLEYSNSNILTENTSSYTYGDGIILWSSNNNTVTGNTTDSNEYFGITLYDSSNNILTGNTTDSNDETAIALYYGSNNTLRGNTVSNNWEGIVLSSSSNNILEGNTLSNNGTGIWLFSSNSNTLTGNIGLNTEEGIYLQNSSNNILTGNTASYNDYGIRLYDSSNNILTGNTASNNSFRGISLSSSSYNQIYNNNLINNWGQVSEYGSSGNVFNLSAPIGGNYWSDHTGPDADGDGFVDYPYVIGGGQDDLPWTMENGWGATPEEQILNVINYYEARVEDGTLVGARSGPSGAGQLQAFGNMLEAVRNYIVAEDFSSACEQLDDLYGKCDGLSPPPDFITGDAAAGMASAIQALKVKFGCE